MPPRDEFDHFRISVPGKKYFFVYPAIGAKIDAPHVCHPKRNYLSSSPIKNTRGG